MTRFKRGSEREASEKLDIYRQSIRELVAREAQAALRGKKENEGNNGSERHRMEWRRRRQ